MERKPRWFCTCLCVFVLAELLAFRSALADQSSCPTSISTGQPACGESADVGSSAPSVSNTLHVGNPVDVASGNKYQSDIDAKLADSELSFKRHYNSAQSNINIGVGNGWRHSYSVMLSRIAETQLQIVQSDGRRISFVLDESEFRATHTQDGFISVLPNGRHVWHLPDGRKFLFVGSFLASITFENDRLELLYRDTRLVSVTDSAGRSIDFEYAPGVISLRSYSNSDIDVPAGHLAAIVLPDSSRVEYKYDHLQNLIAVHYPRGTIRSRAVHYSFEDESNKALLTERANALHVPYARWTYDDHERISSYRSSWNIRADGSERGLPDLRFSYSQGSTADIGITSVEDRQGRIHKYEWLVAEGGEVVEILAADPATSEVIDVGETERDYPSDSSSIPIGINDKDTITIVDLDVLGYPSVVEYFHYESARAYEFRVDFSQVGALLRIVYSNPSGSNRIEYTVDKGVISSIVHSSIEGERTATTQLKDRVWEAISSAKFLLQFSIEEFKKEVPLSRKDLTRLSKNPIRWSGFNDGHAERKAKNSVSFNHSCQAPLFDCSRLEQIIDYAEIAQCVYSTSACSSQYTEANLGRLGVGIDDLNGRSFRAQIYRDSQNDEYIVAFAGTHSISSGLWDFIGDWNSNIRQEMGLSAHQYEQAVVLSRMLTALNPNKTFRFTGHSLGGGLATAAAAAVNQNAFVFNPAALTPESALELGILYGNAVANTEIYSVEREVLHHFQDRLSLMSEPPGIFNTLPLPNHNWLQARVPADPAASYAERLRNRVHGIDAVRQSLLDTARRNLCVP